MKKFLGITLLIVIITSILTGCVERYEYKEVKVTVVDKEYHEEYNTTTMLSTGKTIIPMTVHHDARYEITIQYENLQRVIDNEVIYNKVNINDNIISYIMFGYNRKNELETTDLVLNKE